MITVEELIAANPFPGLRSFRPQEADRFFGREQQIDDLVARLDDWPLVAVAGASGCGKSSLVLAGLLNRLAHRTGSGSAEWRPIVLRPGNHPIASLASGLALVLGIATADDEDRAASLEGRLRLGGRGLVEAVRLARLGSHVRLLVVVDQFEEIFRFKRMTDPEEATAFVKLLLYATRDFDSQVNVVLTLRSDALGHCADFRDLPEAINRGQYLVPKLTREGRKAAIVKPVELGGFRIAPRLVQRILNDVTDDFDDLPVMQHVLTRTWQQWAVACQATRPIDLADYEATGGAAKALSNHADEAYASLTGLSAVVERVFRALTERIAEGSEIRRPLNFDRLCHVAGGDKMNIEQVVERFRRPDTAFLMPSSETPLSTDPVIDISHESLIRQWRRLREWTQRELESRQELLRLVEAAHLYAQRHGDLWRGRDLERVLEWRNGEQPTGSWVGLCTGGDGASQWESAQTFLAESEQAVNREKKRDQRRRWALGGLVATIAVVIIAAGILQWQLKLRAESRELANRALLELNQDPAISAHLALAAVDKDDNARAEYALRRSLATLEVAHAERIITLWPDQQVRDASVHPNSAEMPREAITDARFTADKSLLVVVSQKNIRVFDARSYQIIGGPFVRKNTVTKAWLIAKNTLLVTLTNDGIGQIQTVTGDGLGKIHGGPIHMLSCEGDRNIYTLAISSDGRHIATGCYNGELTVWDVTGSDVQRQPSFARGTTDRGATITALNFSADNKYLASGDASGTAMIWKLGQSEPWIGATREGSKQLPLQHAGAIRDITFHPSDSGLLATASDDGTAVVWNLDLLAHGLAPEKKGERSKWVLKHDHPAIKVRFTPRADDQGLLMTIADKRVYFWKNEESKQVRGQDEWVSDAHVSDDGEFIVSAGSDGTARVWSTRSGVLIAVLRGHHNEVTRAFFGPEQQVVTTSRDGSLRIWRLHMPSLLASENHYVQSAAFDPAGKRVAVCGEKQCSIVDPQDISRRRSPDEKLTFADVDRIVDVSWSADGRLLLGVGITDNIDAIVKPILWDVDSRRVITPEWLKQWSMAAFSPRGNELVTVKGSDGALAVWDAAALSDTNPEPKLQFPTERGRWWAKLSPDGRWIAAIEGDRVALYPAKPNSAPRMLIGRHGAINWVSFSPDSRWLVTASTDRIARIWRVDQPGDPVELAGHEAALTSAAFSHDGRQVVTSSDDHTIRVWNARNGQEIVVLRWHGDIVNQVMFDLDGQHILSASDDGTAKLGRCATCNETVAELHEWVLNEVKLDPDEWATLQRESRVIMPYFSVLTFLSKNP